MKYFLFISLCLIHLFHPCNVDALEIALTFDDTPGSGTELFAGMERTRKLIAQLAQHDVKEAGFFCNTHDFSEEKRQRLKLYAQGGHLLGNHTAHHFSYHDTKFEQFVADIEEANNLLKEIPGYQQWFRFPFLAQGTTPSARERINAYLKNHHYRHGYVTVETYDWHLAGLFQQDHARGIEVDREKLKATYLKILWEGIAFYDDLAMKILGRSPKHIILLHENDLHALFIGDLIDLIRSKGGKIISMTEAYTDAINSSEWDQIPFSQRRIRGMARFKQYQGLLYSPWEETKSIDQLYQKMVHGSP